MPTSYEFMRVIFEINKPGNVFGMTLYGVLRTGT